MKSEHLIQQEIQLHTADEAVLFRTNAGKFWQGKLVWSKEYKQKVLINLSPIEGLPDGYSDLSGVRKSDGRAVFIEVKRKDGVVKPKQEQFLKAMAEWGALTGVARSVEDARRIIEDGLDRT
jgi:hypothetical protein